MVTIENGERVNTRSAGVIFLSYFMTLWLSDIIVSPSVLFRGLHLPAYQVPSPSRPGVTLYDLQSAHASLQLQVGHAQLAQVDVRFAEPRLNRHFVVLTMGPPALLPVQAGNEIEDFPFGEIGPAGG